MQKTQQHVAFIQRMRYVAAIATETRSPKFTQIGQSLLEFGSCFSVGHLPCGMNLTNSTGVTSGQTDRSSLKQRRQRHIRNLVFVSE